MRLTHTPNQVLKMMDERQYNCPSIQDNAEAMETVRAMVVFTIVVGTVLAACMLSF